MPITSQVGPGHPDLAILKPNPLLFQQFHFSYGRVQQRWAQSLLKKIVHLPLTAPSLRNGSTCASHPASLGLRHFASDIFQLFSSVPDLKSTHSCPPSVAGMEETLQLLQRSPVRREDVPAMAHPIWLLTSRGWMGVARFSPRTAV